MNLQSFSIGIAHKRSDTSHVRIMHQTTLEGAPKSLEHSYAHAIFEGQVTLRLT